MIHSTGSLMHQGVTGLQNSSQRILEAATDVVEATTVNKETASTAEIVDPLIEMKQQQLLFDASAKVVKTADRALGALLDVKA